MKNLLLDTNVLVAYVLNSRKIGKRSASLLNKSNLFFSPLSIFELKIKEARLKNFRSPLTAAILTSLGLKSLSFDAEVSELVQTLSHDPFDVLLVSQAKSRGMQFVTADMQILRSDLDFVLDVTD